MSEDVKARAMASIFAPEPAIDGPFGFEARDCGTRFILRGATALKIAGLAFGAAIPTLAMTATLQNQRAALWLGPDEWLLLAGGGDTALIAQHLRSAMGEAPHSLVDISHRQGAMLVSGSLVEKGLNVVVPLDLGISAFPIGHCTRTLFEKTEIVLWRRSALCFQIEAGRSFLPYLTRYLMLIEEEMRISRR